MKRGFGKSAQISIFVIIAVVIVVLIGVFLFFQNSSEQSFDSMSFDQQVEVIRSTAEDCFEIVYKDSLDYIGVQGGYYEEPFGYYVEDRGLYFPIYVYNGEPTLPTKEFIEGEISQVIDNNLNICLNLVENGFSVVNFDYQDHHTEVSILENVVEFETLFSITLSNDEASVRIDFEKKEIKSDLDKMIKIADYYVSSQIVDKDFICIDCIAEAAENYDLNIEILNYQEDIIIFSIDTRDGESYPKSFKFLEAYDSSLDIDIPEFYDFVGGEVNVPNVTGGLE